MTRSFGDFSKTFEGAPAHLSVLVSRVDVSKGREELYRDQMPELLQALSAQSRVESIRASVAIEGVDVSEDRAERLSAESPPRFRNRNEKEFAGYRDAVDALMRDDRPQAPTPALVLRLHRLLYAHTRVAGGELKQDDNVISDRDEQGHRRVVFEPPAWQQTPGLIEMLCRGYNEAVAAEAAHPLFLLAAFILDFLAIHPVADGNGRTARLLTTHELLRQGYGVARYLSIEQRIYESKNVYYEKLEESQRGWHEGEHKIWPWAEYLVSVLAKCYEGFEARIAAARGSESMGKSDRVRHWVTNLAPESIRMADARKALPGVSDGTIRNVFRALASEGKLKAPSSGGPAAAWQRPDSP